MRRPLALATAAAVLALGLGGASAASADPPHNPGGPCLQPNQNVSLSSVAGYDDVVRELDRIERTSRGLVSVASAGASGEGRDLLYATVGHGPTTFWLQARIHGNELHSTEAVLQILDHLASGDPTARLIRDQLTVAVIPMYNPDGAEANIRQSTTPTASTSTVTGRTSHNRNRWRSGSCGATSPQSWRSICTTWARRPWSTAPTISTSSRSAPGRSTRPE